MSQEKLNELHIDVHSIFDLVCWARYFGVAQSRVKQAVAAVGSGAGQVATFLQVA